MDNYILFLILVSITAVNVFCYKKQHVGPRFSLKNMGYQRPFPKEIMTSSQSLFSQGTGSSITAAHTGSLYPRGTRKDTDRYEPPYCAYCRYNEWHYCIKQWCDSPFRPGLGPSFSTLQYRARFGLSSPSVKSRATFGPSSPSVNFKAGSGQPFRRSSHSSPYIRISAHQQQQLNIPKQQLARHVQQFGVKSQFNRMRLNRQVKKFIPTVRRSRKY